MSWLRRISILFLAAAAAAMTLGFASAGAVAQATLPGSAQGAALSSPAAITTQYPCTAPFGSVQISASAWDKNIINTGHDGADLNVYSNYLAGGTPSACDRSWQSSDGMGMWGEKYQCAELAIRVADAEWATGSNAAWTSASVNWDGAAADMRAPGQKLGLTWTANGSGTLPAPGDLMIWSSSGGTDPGHVAVVSAVGNGTVTFVGENQGDGMVTLPVTGTTVENSGWKSGSTITGWLSHQWKTPTIPLPANAGTGNYGFLASVACPLTNSCVAVGYYIDSAGARQGLIETGFANSWTPTEVQLPANANPNPNTYLESVACPSSTSCVAVGYYNNATAPLLVTWSGTTWTATEAPLPSDAQPGVLAFLTSVACPSAASCVAVGGYNGERSELLVTGFGSVWTPTEAPLPLNALNLAGGFSPTVACASVTSCVTAWIYDDLSGNQEGLLETGAGSAWTPTEAPLPANASAGNPQVSLGPKPIACATATSCVLVGQYIDSSGNREALVVSGAGTTWTPVQALLPANHAAVSNAALTAVACRSATSCVAVGQYTDKSGNTQGMALTSSGATWIAVGTPAPVNAQGNPLVRFDSIACPYAGLCVETGAYAIPDGAVVNYEGLITVGVGATWSTTEAPLPNKAYSQTTYLYSAACPLKTSCVAVGGYDSGPNWSPLIVKGAP